MLKDQVTGETASNNKRPPIEMSAVLGMEWSVFVLHVSAFVCVMSVLKVVCVMWTQMYLYATFS